MSDENESLFKEIYNGDEELIEEYYNDGALPTSFIQLPWGGYYTKLAGNKDESEVLWGNDNYTETFGQSIRRMNYDMIFLCDGDGEKVFDVDIPKCYLCGGDTIIVDHAKKEAEYNLLFEREIWSIDGSVKQSFCKDCVEKEVYLEDGAWFPDLLEMYRAYKYVDMYKSSHDYNCRLFWERIDDYEQNGE